MTIRLMNDPNAVAFLVPRLGMGDDVMMTSDGFDGDSGASLMDPNGPEVTDPNLSVDENGNWFIPDPTETDPTLNPIDVGGTAVDDGPIDPLTGQLYSSDWETDSSGNLVRDDSGQPIPVQYGTNADGSPMLDANGNPIPVIGITSILTPTPTPPEQTDMSTDGNLQPPIDPTAMPTSGGGSGSPTSGGGPSIKPVLQISVSPSQIAAGQTATLTWQAFNATKVTFNGQTLPLSGTMQVKPTSSTKYTMTANGPGGTDTESATLTIGASSNPLSNLLNSVTAPAPTITASASPSTIPVGSSTHISWSTKNATSVIANGQSQPLSGSVVVAPLATTTYTLTATSATGKTVSTQLTITVAAAGTAPSGTVNATGGGSGLTSVLTGTSAGIPNWAWLAGGLGAAVFLGRRK